MPQIETPTEIKHRAPVEDGGDLVQFLDDLERGFDLADPGCIRIVNANGAALTAACLKAVTLTDGSVVYDIELNFDDAAEDAA